MWGQNSREAVWLDQGVVGDEVRHMTREQTAWGFL